jgi:tetratricopeptide (TPR) repeat protein
MLQASVLARSIAALRQKQRTGRLSVDADSSRTFVYLRQGHIVFAEEGTQGETLGRLLVRQKLLSQEQYLSVLSKMTDALVSNEQIRFGETAVELGFLSEQQVRSALVDQVRWKVVRCFMREAPTWSFVDGESLVEDVPELVMTLEGLFFDAAQWFEREQNFECGLGKVLGRYVFLEPSTRMPLAYALNLDETHTEALGVFDGQRTTSELLQRSPGAGFPMEAVLTTLAVLQPACFLEQRFVPKAEPSRAPAQPAAPRRAPAPPPPAPAPAAAPARPAIPVAIAPPIDRARVSQVFQRIAEQPQPKAQVEAHFRAPKSDQERRLLAEQAYQHGRKHLDAGRREQALTHLRRAVELEPDNKEYGLVVDFTEQRDRLGTDAVASSRLRRAAVEILRADPNFAQGFYIAGYLQFVAGEYAAAKRYLLRSLSLDPTLVDAERYLRLSELRLAPKPAR